MHNCFQLWNPYSIKETIALEKIEGQATKYILKDDNTDYQTCFLKLHLLPLMHTLDNSLGTYLATSNNYNIPLLQQNTKTKLHSIYGS